MIDGLNSTNNGIDYIMNTIKPDGILTTKSNVVAHAYKNNISVIQRFFYTGYSFLRESFIKYKRK